MGIVMAVGGGGEQEVDGQTDSAQTTGKIDPSSPRWTKRYVDTGRFCTDHREAAWQELLEKYSLQITSLHDSAVQD
jgi:hypothetical protein